MSTNLFIYFSQTNACIAQYASDLVCISLRQISWARYSSQAIKNQEREAFELHELADSIILECKQNRPVSTLETAIFLLRQVLDERPPSNPLRSDALHHLLIALLIRFNQWGWIEDNNEAVKIMNELIQSAGIVDHHSDVITETHVRQY